MLRRFTTSIKPRSSVGFVGCGAMGSQLANRIKQGGFDTLVWDISPEASERHQNTYGTKAVTNLTDLSDCGFIFTCVPESKDVQTAVDNLSPSLAPGTVWVDCTSGDSCSTKLIGESLAKNGVQMVDCAVSGGPAGAAAGTLASMCGSNDPSNYEKALPILETYSAKSVFLGPLGAGHATKSINNLLNVTHLMLAAEGIATLTKMGVDPRKALSVINAASGRSLQTEVRLPSEVLSRDFNYGFKLGLMMKDVRIATAMIDETHADVGGIEKVAPLSAASRVQLRKATDKYGFDVDYTYAAKFVEDEMETVIQSPDQK